MSLYAQLNSPHPYAHEIAQGHWDIPQDVLDGNLKTDEDTNRKLFKDFPDWALICVMNPAHTYDVALPGERRIRGSGVWWIWEAHPNITPREWGPSFPLLFRDHPDGEAWVDRACGKPFHPRDCYPLIAKTLRYKDIFNTARYRDLGDNIREADRVAEAKERATEKALADLRAEFLRDEVNDQSTVKGGSKQFVPSNFVSNAVKSLRKKFKGEE